MAKGKSKDYEEAVKKAVESSFSETAKVSKLDVGEEQEGVVTATVVLFEGGKTSRRADVSRDGDYWVAKTI